MKKTWITPLGIFIAILITLSSTTFNNFILEAAVWEAIFTISLVISFLWLIRSLYEYIKSDKPEKIVEEFIDSAMVKQSSSND